MSQYDGDPTTYVVELLAKAQEFWELKNPTEMDHALRQALELAERLVGAENPLVSIVLSKIAWLATIRGHLDQSIMFLRRSLAIRESKLGATHVGTFEALEELASVLFQAKGQEEGYLLALRAIDGFKSLGRADIPFANFIETVAWYRIGHNHNKDAESLYRLALSMKECLIGPMDHSTAETIGRLALIYDDSEFDVDPEPYYLKALQAMVVNLGDNHSGTIDSRYRLAAYLERQGRLDEATFHFNHLIATFKVDNSLNIIDTYGYVLSACCRFLYRMGRDGEAVILQRLLILASPHVAKSQHMAMKVEVGYGSQSLEFAAALASLASALASAARPEQAQEATIRALAIRQLHFGLEDPLIKASIANLAHIPEQVASIDSINHYLYAWRDGRRSEFIRMYLKACTSKERFSGSASVKLAMSVMKFEAEIDEQWQVIVELIFAAPEDASVLSLIASGPLEGFLSRFDGQVIDQVESEALHDAKFRRVVSGVWRDNKISEQVWNRLCKIRATVPNPLPEEKEFESLETFD